MNSQEAYDKGVAAALDVAETLTGISKVAMSEGLEKTSKSKGLWQGFKDYHDPKMIQKGLMKSRGSKEFKGRRKGKAAWEKHKRATGTEARKSSVRRKWGTGAVGAGVVGGVGAGAYYGLKDD